MNIKKAVPIMQRGIKTMQKLGIDKAVNDFEEVFETLDVKTGAMNEALDGVHSSSISNNQVDELMNQLQAEANYEASNQMGNVASGQVKAGGEEEKDDLMERLRNL